jgi:hypothetical protein
MAGTNCVFSVAGARHGSFLLGAPTPLPTRSVVITGMDAMKRWLAKRLYNLTGNLGWIFIELASRWPLGEYFEWPYRIGNWLYGQHYYIALKYGFWKKNPAYVQGGDEPLYIDARLNTGSTLMSGKTRIISANDLHVITTQCLAAAKEIHTAMCLFDDEHFAQKHLNAAFHSAMVGAEMCRQIHKSEKVRIAEPETERGCADDGVGI